MKFCKSIIICFFFIACDANDNEEILDLSLSNYLFNREIETGAVIACSASDATSNTIFTFFYPENGATNFRFYNSINTAIDQLDYSKYTLASTESEAFFNGYLRRYLTEKNEAHWIIITYELEDEIKISNPIRTKQIEKPTVWNDAVAIDLSMPLMPHFTWENNAVGENAIYFQVISNANNDLISGTYTYENNFKFYDVSNVVLNISGATPALENQNGYNFTLMDVSLDNWVNLVSQKAFITQ